MVRFYNFIAENKLKSSNKYTNEKIIEPDFAFFLFYHKTCCPERNSKPT